MELHRPYSLKYFVYCATAFVQLQMAALCLDASVETMKVTAWNEGTAVYYWFNHNVFGAPIWMRTSLAALFSNPFIIVGITWGVILLEMFLFTAIFLNRRYKYIIFIVTAAFHFLIFLTHGLPTFGIAMWSGLIFYLWRMDFTIQKNISNIRKLFSRSLGFWKQLFNSFNANTPEKSVKLTKVH